tara:strand:- start:359 stop:634 length:276 start_codon:yes stop_codon:yes gene_type:complete
MRNQPIIGSNDQNMFFHDFPTSLNLRTHIESSTINEPRKNNSTIISIEDENTWKTPDIVSETPDSYRPIVIPLKKLSSISNKIKKIKEDKE